MPKVFVCYSRKDYRWVITPPSETEQALFPFVRDKLRNREIDFWWDDRLEDSVGEDYTERITEAIGTSDTAVLLISEHFFMSEYIDKMEMPIIRARVEAGEMKLFPIVVANWDPKQNDHSLWVHGRQIALSRERPLIEIFKDPAEFDRYRSNLARRLRGMVLGLREDPGLSDSSSGSSSGENHLTDIPLDPVMAREAERDRLADELATQRLRTVEATKKAAELQEHLDKLNETIAEERLRIAADEKALRDKVREAELGLAREAQELAAARQEIERLQAALRNPGSTQEIRDALRRGREAEAKAREAEASRVDAVGKLREMETLLKESSLRAEQAEANYRAAGKVIDDLTTQTEELTAKTERLAEGHRRAAAAANRQITELRQALTRAEALAKAAPAAAPPIPSADAGRKRATQTGIALLALLLVLGITWGAVILLALGARGKTHGSGTSSGPGGISSVTPTPLPLPTPTPAIPRSVFQ